MPAIDLRKQFSELTRMPYKDQAVWFLNGFWKDGLEAESENIWNFTQKFVELDLKNKAAGNELDEFGAHRFLESFGETLTVVDMRAQLKKIDIDVNQKCALIEYLIFRYNKNMESVVNAPQGDNAELLEAAQAMLAKVQSALEHVRQELEIQTARFEEQKAAEEAVRQSERELRQAVQELENAEREFNETLRKLEETSTDESISTVKRNKAAAELAQLKCTDPLPLRRAKITQEVAVRKVEKDRKAQEEITQQVLKQKLVVEKAYDEARERVAEAEAYLQEVKRKGGVAHGAIWWMERELLEARRYLPLSKGGIPRK